MEKNKSGIYLAIPEAVVVGNGEFPSHPFPLSVLDQAPCVVCCDGGANALVESGRLPDWIVGDGDSLSEENRIRFQDRIHRIPDQETNDQTKVVSFLASQGIRRIAILGATGKREDHTLGNISLLGIGLEEQIKISLVDEHNRIRMINQPLTIRKAEQYGKYVSLIPFSEKVSGVTLRGLKYPLTDYTMGGFNSLGISNEIVSDEASISLSSGQLIVIESKD